jgi:hypothetical protein
VVAGRAPATSAFNISPTYDRGRISVGVGLSYNQASIYSLLTKDWLSRLRVEQQPFCAIGPAIEVE